MSAVHRLLIATGLVVGFLALGVPADAKGPFPYELVITGVDQFREIRIPPQEFMREVSGASGYFYGFLDSAAAPTSLPSAAYQVDLHLYVREELTIQGWVARTIFDGPGPNRQRQLFLRLTYYLASDHSSAIARVESSPLAPHGPGEWLKPTPQLEGLIDRAIRLGRWLPKSAADTSHTGGWWPAVALGLAGTILLTVRAWRSGLSQRGLRGAVPWLFLDQNFCVSALALSRYPDAGTDVQAKTR